jgi:hypothetical protein
VVGKETLSLSPKLAFDVCHEVYAAIRGDLDGIALIDPNKVPSDHCWRPQSGPRGEEYVADFALAGRKALSRPEDASRLILFNLFYLALNPYQSVRHFIGLREDTWAMWTEEIREAVGREIIRRQMFPPRNYFNERTKPRKQLTGKINGKPASAHAVSTYGMNYLRSTEEFRGLARGSATS